MNRGSGLQPAADDPAAEKPPTLLVVEDDVLVRISTASYLRDAGFVVIEAATAAEAIRLVGAEGSVELVFSDIDMPGTMDGVGLAQWIGEKHPRIKVLLTSGAAWTGEPAVLRIAPFLPKPYRFDDLEHRIRGLLQD